jgi:hypothetical protein
MTTTIRNARKLSRRHFIVASAAAGGGLALGFKVPFGDDVATAAPAANAGAEVNAWVVIRPDDTCVIRIARTEMGKRVMTESVTPGTNLARKRIWGEMGTGGSRGIRTSHDYVRRGGAAARMMLLQAAANQWMVPVSELTVSNGVIAHATSKRTTTYGKVAAAAAKLDPPDPKSITLKDPKTWTIAGKPMKRLDTADKLNGSKQYAIDVKLPGMLCAAIKDAPVFGSKVVSYDESKIAGRPGVRRVVKVNDTAVAVVADTWWHAKSALDALSIVWDEDKNGSVSSATIASHLEEGLSASVTNGSRQNGDAVKAIADAPKKLQHALPCPRHHGADEHHGDPLGRQGRGMGAEPERRGVARGTVRVLRHTARQMRGLPQRPRRRLRPARRHAGLRAQGGGDRQGIPRCPDQDDLEPRGGHGARFLPADLTMQDVGRARRRRQSRWAAYPHIRAVDQCVVEPDRDRGRPRHAPAARLVDAAG